ncbi:MAG: NAD(+) synthase [Verrucomicrobia bacterium]|nr:NAD(+) synthase [Verrucomicrobiota bacterium]
MGFSKSILQLDPAAEADRLVRSLKEAVQGLLRRHGAVVGISGGVDSAVVLCLCARAFDASKIVAVMMPDKDSNPQSEKLARDLARECGVNPVLENVTAALEGFGCYRRRDEAIRQVAPEYEPGRGFKAKIVLPQNLLQENTLNVFSLVIVDPDGRERSLPLPARQFLQIVAASNFKQRARMATLYYHAELHNFAVIGTANKNEHDQGFFVKYGDAGVDVTPLGHLYKTQVYQLAAYLGVPEAIRSRPPTSDTYSAPCTEQEFFFRLPFETMDLLWYAQEHDVPAAEVAAVMGLPEAQVRRAFDDFTRKSRTTGYLRLPPLRLNGRNKVSSAPFPASTARAVAPGGPCPKPQILTS